MEKRYHIYKNDNCINYYLTEEEFNTLWNQYMHLAEIHGMLKKDDLSYEEVIDNKADYSIQGSILFK